MSRHAKRRWKNFLIRLRNNDLIYFPYTFFRGLISANKYRKVHSILMFLGYPRSGSSTLASLLDAHKNIIIAHELNLLHYVQHKYGPRQIFFMLDKNSRILAAKERVSAGYKGVVDGQYNGRSDRCLIIGDKKAGSTSRSLMTNPVLLAKIRLLFGKKLKCIHIIRNPFDMIATQSYGGNEKKKPLRLNGLEYAINQCFEKIDTISKIKEMNEFDIFDIRHENLIADPDYELRRLFDWLEAELYPGYLEACKRHLYDQPHRSRFRVNWTEEQKKMVQKKIDSTSFLSGYHFKS